MIRRLVPAVLAVILLGSATAAAQDSVAVAVNTRDGASLFRLAFHITRVMGDVVDQGNAAVAASSCSECQTVALAFQVVLVMGDAETITPTNLAIAYNQDCLSCTTYASATQLVLGTDGVVRFTPEGNRRLAELRQRLNRLRTEELTIEQLNAEVEAVQAELRDILATELLPAGQPTTTTTAAGTSTTSPPAGDTEGSPATTSTTRAPTSSTTAPSSTSTEATTTTQASTTSTTAGG